MKTRHECNRHSCAQTCCKRPVNALESCKASFLRGLLVEVASTGYEEHKFVAEVWLALDMKNTVLLLKYTYSGSHILMCRSGVGRMVSKQEIQATYVI